LTGMGLIVVLAGGGLIGYLSSSRHPVRQNHHAVQSALPAKVLTVQTVGLIDVGPYDDRDPSTNDADDHPLMLRLTSAGIEFVSIPRSELAAGVPLWTADQMADGTVIFIYSPTGQCLAAAPGGRRLALVHCDLGRAQRWRARLAGSAEGLPFDQFASLAAGRCLSAPPTAGAPPRLAPCGATHDKSEEIGFWWSA